MTNYYLTTPIYYVNAAPHIGHTYTTIAADVIRKVKTMQGYHAVLTTGTDEHGQKIERAAKAAGKSPEEFTTVVSDEFRRQWETFGIPVDHFRRTTDPRHHKIVQQLFTRCQERGHVYKGSYTGQYCVFDELYVSDAKPGDPCPDCGRPTETVTEENYFFRLSAFTQRLIDFHEQNPTFLQPDTRRNEVLAFLRQENGLSDLSISRTTIRWGIPLPVEGNHVFYVWFDALSTYISAVVDDLNGIQADSLWPADLHLIGKEIVRFHAIYWPAFLMAAELPLPRKVYAHGWLLFENDKMSKSRGNIVRATPIQQVMGADALRYYLLREVVFGQDGSFSYDALVQRYNADLANGLGNLASRTLSMIHQYRGGVVPQRNIKRVVTDLLQQGIADALNAYNSFQFSKALEAVMGLVRHGDQYIVAMAPWKAHKDGKQDVVDCALYTATALLTYATALAWPVLPETAQQIWAQLGFRQTLGELLWKDHLGIDARQPNLTANQINLVDLIGGRTTQAPTAVYPRIEAGPAIDRMRELEQQETERQNVVLGKTTPDNKAAASEPAPAAPVAAETAAETAYISIDDFSKVDLRVGLVMAAAPVPKADKLLHLTVDLGEGQPRTILAGIAQYYQPDALVGRKVVVVANLAPRKMRGVESQGMIVAASLEGGAAVLAGFLEDVPVGARLK